MSLVDHEFQSTYNVGDTLRTTDAMDDTGWQAQHLRSNYGHLERGSWQGQYLRSNYGHLEPAR
jgi:hypothetical protein